MFAPRFTKIPGNVELLEEETVEMKVEAYGKPVPEITWSLGDLSLSGDKRRKIQTSKTDKSYKTKSSLTIDKAEMDDTSDVYKIEAKNKIGSATHTVALLGNMVYSMLGPCKNGIMFYSLLN